MKQEFYTKNVKWLLWVAFSIAAIGASFIPLGIVFWTGTISGPISLPPTIVGILLVSTGCFHSLLAFILLRNVIELKHPLIKTYREGLELRRPGVIRCINIYRIHWCDLATPLIVGIRGNRRLRLNGNFIREADGKVRSYADLNLFAFIDPPEIIVQSLQELRTNPTARDALPPWPSSRFPVTGGISSPS